MYVYVYNLKLALIFLKAGSVLQMNSLSGWSFILFCSLGKILPRVFKRFYFKGTVSVISSDPLCIDGRSTIYLWFLCKSSFFYFLLTKTNGEMHRSKHFFSQKTTVFIRLRFKGHCCKFYLWIEGYLKLCLQFLLLGYAT